MEAADIQGDFGVPEVEITVAKEVGPDQGGRGGQQQKHARGRFLGEKADHWARNVLCDPRIGTGEGFLAYTKGRLAQELGVRVIQLWILLRQLDFNCRAAFG